MTTTTSTRTDPATAPTRSGAALISVAPSVRRARVGLRSAGIVPWLMSRGPTCASVAIGAGGALLLGGDAVRLDVRVAAGCTLAIEDVGGTVAYDGEGHVATWAVDVVLGDGARLVWRALPFVVADGAEVERSMMLTLGAGASALVRETLVLGRSGERGGGIVSSLRVHDDVGPVIVETLRVRGDSPVPGILGGHRVLDSVVAVSGHHPGHPTAAPQAVENATVLHLERGGRVVRALGADAHAVDLSAEFERMAEQAPTRAV